MATARYRNGFAVTLHEDLLDLPLRWRKPRRVFVNSMSDLFHDDIPLSFIQQVFATMRRASWHTFQVLTKRAERLAAVAGQIDWPENVWIGVTVESGRYAFRAGLLRRAPAAVRFLSIEPMIGPVDGLDLGGIDWVIVGGESGPGARPMRRAWAASVRDQCVAAGVPFFFKQWGGVRKKQHGRLLDGKVWDQYPNKERGPRRPCIQPVVPGVANAGRGLVAPVGSAI